ncbi:hypothetical protein V5O48_016139 [Marasmius crinis-equi]|uniref:Uncharacterized protein n=1 Tax=Marasmius crinis-equi TaxID=585013 RepID=A0ABR3ESI3_9AGAR
MKPNNVLQEEEDLNWPQNWSEATKAQNGAQGVTDEGLQKREMENRLSSCPIERLVRFMSSTKIWKEKHSLEVSQRLQEEGCLQIGVEESLMKFAAEEKFKSFKVIQGTANGCGNA